MAPKAKDEAGYLELPNLVFGAADVRRLARELESLEDYLRQARVRQPGKQVPLPKTSRLLDTLASGNKLNLLASDDRERLRLFLANLDKKAPIVHLSFAVDPSSAFTAKIVTWLRANIHPYMLVQIGLQPNITAGCTVRVNSRVFNFSLKERLQSKRSILTDALEKMNQEVKAS